MKNLIFLALSLTLAFASPAYYGYSSPRHVPKASYAIPRPSYASPKASYSEPYYKPSPYNFGYNIDDGYGNNNYQNEDGDDYGNKKGSYGYTDAYGIYRKVDYVADNYGYRATITTNEPGTANASPADVKLYSKEPPQSVYAEPAYHEPSYAPRPSYEYGPSPYRSSYRAPYRSSYRRY